VQAHDAARVGLRSHEREARDGAVGEQALSAAERERVKRPVQLVDEVMEQQRVQEIRLRITDSGQGRAQCTVVEIRSIGHEPRLGPH
jgi:hypothetical protein